jgi:hypothetical protein
MRFSLRSILMAITVVAVAIAMLVHHPEAVIAITLIVLWLVGTISKSGFVEAWPELKGPQLPKLRRSAKAAPLTDNERL